MATNMLLVLAVLYLGHQVAEAGRCVTTSGELTCDASCNEIGTCPAATGWRMSENCQASGKVCRVVDKTATCVSYDSGATHCNEEDTIVCPAVSRTTMFPSIDCTNYYICSEEGKTTTATQCAGRAFNSCTQKCSDFLYNGACLTNSSSLLCTGLNAGGGIAPGNDALYYSCEIDEKTPKWNVCPVGSRFSLTSRTCQDVGSVSTCTVCAGAQRIPGPVAHSGSRCKYVWCHSRDDFEVRSCQPGWYYLDSQRGCVYGWGMPIPC